MTTDYTYNADGERTSAGSSSYTWNAAGQLTSSTVSGTTSAYTYDGDGTRVSSTTSETSTTYVFDVGNPVPLLAQESQAGAETNRFVYGDGVLLSMRTGDSDYYVCHDASGSTVALTSSTGTTDTTFTYDPYGNLRIENKIVSSAPPTPLLFEGQLLDPDGLYQLQARDMDPATGTFLSVDPISQPAISPQLSPYLYAEDQPTVLWDPTGQCADATDAYINNLEYGALQNYGLEVNAAGPGTTAGWEEAGGFGSDYIPSEGAQSAATGVGGILSLLQVANIWNDSNDIYVPE
jgi:RHS repeat-associated protein